MRLLRDIGLPALALVLGAATTFGIGMLLLPPPRPARPAPDAGPASAVTTGSAFQPGSGSGGSGATSASAAAPDDDTGTDAATATAWPITAGGAAGAGAAADDDVPAAGSEEDDDDTASDAGASPPRPAWVAPTGTPQATPLRAEVGELTYVRCSSADAGRPTPGDRCGRLPAIERRVTQILARDAGRCVAAVEPDADTLRLALEVRFDLGTVRVWAGQASTLQGVGSVVHCMRRVLLTGPEGTPRFSLEGVPHREDRYTMFVSLRFSEGESQRSAPSSTNR
ncbi:MAG: hypothetical protein IT379_12475 [Deltaproteobacteria bacterium]|nr:hypothetical protein [Deltaproteobacteria bacterium]